MSKGIHSQERAVMIAAGGTGGHVFPALAVAERLREMQIPVHWVGTERGIEARVVPAAGFSLHTIPVAGVRGKNIIAWMLAPFRIVRSVLQLFTVIKEHRIAVVLGMGGYVSFAAGLTAIVTRKPLALQEQNAVAGSANRLLAPFARRIFTGFDGVLSQYRQTEWSGNPLRQPFCRRDDKGHGVSHPLTLLILGGSLGAHSLNITVPLAIDRWRSTEGALPAFNVIHQTGEADYEEVRDTYSQMGIEAEVLPFIDDVYQSYSKADLIVARAGALTVSEIAAVSVASILVPYPHAIDDHQTANASHLASAGAAILLPQEQLTADTLANHLNQLLADRSNLVEMANAAITVGRHNATEMVANACAEFCYG